jgi:hypothetical protein
MDARRMRALFALLLAALVIFGAGALGSAEPENSVLLTLSVIDVGQRDSILISTSDGHAMLVDGGPADASGKVLEAIRKAGQTNVINFRLSGPTNSPIGADNCFWRLDTPNSSPLGLYDLGLQGLHSRLQLCGHR